jgi:hypothetical protein
MYYALNYIADIQIARLGKSQLRGILHACVEWKKRSKYQKQKHWRENELKDIPM